MQKVRDILVNTLIFFFVITLLDGAVRLNTSSGVLDKVLVGILYGVIVIFASNVLKFFKLPLTNVLVLSATTFLSLIFALVTSYVLRLIIFSRATINLGVESIQPIQFTDATISLLVFSIITALLTFVLVNKR